MNTIEQKSSLSRGISIGIGLAVSVLLIYFGFLLLQRRTTQASASITNAKVSDNTSSSLEVTFATNTDFICSVEAQSDSQTIALATDDVAITEHRLTVDGLSADTSYDLLITCGESTKTLKGKTAAQESTFSTGGGALPTIVRGSGATNSKISASELKACVLQGKTVQECADSLEK